MCAKCAMLHGFHHAFCNCNGDGNGDGDDDGGVGCDGAYFQVYSV